MVWRAIAFAPGGAKAVLLGNVASPVEGRIYLWDEASAQLTQMTTETFAGGTYESIAWSSGRVEGSPPRGEAQRPAPTSPYLWAFDLDTGRSDVKAKATSAGRQDLAWATDGFDDARGPGHLRRQWCHAASTSIAAATSVDYTQNAGNTSRISARPQGDYALAIGWSGQRVYRFSKAGGRPPSATPPSPASSRSASPPTATARSSSAGYGGNPAVARAYEFRHDLF